MLGFWEVFFYSQVDDERRRNQQIFETVNDLESELSEEQARSRLAEERITILKAKAERDEVQRQKLEQRRSEKDLRPDLKAVQLEQEIEIYKKEVSWFDFNLREAVIVHI